MTKEEPPGGLGRNKDPTQASGILNWDWKIAKVLIKRRSDTDTNWGILLRTTGFPNAK